MEDLHQHLPAQMDAAEKSLKEHEAEGVIITNANLAGFFGLTLEGKAKVKCVFGQLRAFPDNLA